MVVQSFTYHPCILFLLYAHNKSTHQKEQTNKPTNQPHALRPQIRLPHTDSLLNISHHAPTKTFFFSVRTPHSQEGVVPHVATMCKQQADGLYVIDRKLYL